MSTNSSGPPAVKSGQAPGLRGVDQLVMLVQVLEDGGRAGIPGVARGPGPHEDEVQGPGGAAVVAREVEAGGLELLALSQPAVGVGVAAEESGEVPEVGLVVREVHEVPLRREVGPAVEERLDPPGHGAPVQASALV